MKTQIHYLILVVIMLAACKETEINESNAEIEQIFQQFHGKYQVISSTSDELVDLNYDGKASTDLLQEIPDLENANLVIIISDYYLFHQLWPEQHIPSYIDPEDTTYRPVYARQGVARVFQLNESRDSIFFDEQDQQYLDEFPLPEKYL